ELYNADTMSIQLNDYFIRIDSSQVSYYLPRAIMQPGSYFTLWLTGQESKIGESSWHAPALSRDNYSIYLYNAVSNSISDKIQLSAKPFENESIARSKDGIGEFILLSPEKVSFNAPN